MSLSLPKSLCWSSLSAFVLCTLLLATPAHAVDREDSDDQDGSEWGIGVGASIKKSLYKGVGNDNTYLPLISYESKYVRLFANVLDAKLPSAGPFDFAIRAKFAIGEGYGSSQSPYLTGMASRHGSTYLGGAAAWHAGVANLTVEYLKDVSGNSGGSQMKLGLDHSFIFERRFQVTPHASITRFDSNYVDYYYGVKASEATLGRPAYEGKATTQSELGVRLGYSITPNQRVLFDVVDTHWGAGVSKSPLVDRASSPGILLGYLYGF